jgi:multiple sugar transport system permease protein
MTVTGTSPATDSAERAATLPRTRIPRRRTVVAGVEIGERGIVSTSERRKPRVRRGLFTLHGLLLVGLAVVGLGPILWLAKAAVTPTQDTLRYPMQLWPHGLDWSNVSNAWSQQHISKYFVNTLIVAAGSWASQIIVAATGGYALSVLRPRYGKVITGMVLGTLLIPSIVLLVPLYLTVLNVPVLHISLINSFWAVWLPAGANPFNVLLVKRFFDNLPREVFEAARVDGAGPYRVFWSVVLPMSRPILGVVSVFAIITAWKDYLWPLLVLADPNKQPLSVRLPTIADQIDLGTLLAALFISTIIPIALFLIFQRLFLRSAGLGGAVKG